MKNAYTAEDWRKRAEQVRARAEQTFDPQAQRIVLDIAAAYERLAEMAEKRSKNLVSA